MWISLIAVIIADPVTFVWQCCDLLILRIIACWGLYWGSSSVSSEYVHIQSLPENQRASDVHTAVGNDPQPAELPNQRPKPQWYAPL